MLNPRSALSVQAGEFTSIVDLMGDLEWFPLPRNAPPSTVFPTRYGVTHKTERESYYGSTWETTPSGGISFELDDEDLRQRSLASTLNVPSIDSVLSGYSRRSMSRSGGTKGGSPTKRSRQQENQDLKETHPLTNDEKLHLARNHINEFKFKGNGMSVPPTPVPPRSALRLRDSGHFDEHIPKKDQSLWRPTPRLLRDPERTKETIRGRLDLSTPQDFVNHRPKPSQAMVVQAIQIARLAKSKGRYLETRKKYTPVERELFQSPYNKPCWGKWASSPPKIDEKLMKTGI